MQIHFFPVNQFPILQPLCTSKFSSQMLSLYFHVIFTFHVFSMCIPHAPEGIPERQYENRQKEKDDFLENKNFKLATLKFHMRGTSLVILGPGLHAPFYAGGAMFDSWSGNY